MVTENRQIVLASASPRRTEILAKLDVPFIQYPVHIDETVQENEEPKLYARRMAQEKAEACASRYSDHLILSADTIVVADNRILLKPENHIEAREMLELLSGRWHSVLTAMTLMGDKTATFISESRVKFKKMTEEEMEWYIDSGEPWDKAGGYGIQGKAAVLIERFEGDYDTIVGLASRQLPEMFEQIGLNFYTFIV
jgi:septum formation protein